MHILGEGVNKTYYIKKKMALKHKRMYWRKAVNQTGGEKKTLEIYTMMHRKYYMKREVFKLETDLEIKQDELKIWKKK